MFYSCALVFFLCASGCLLTVSLFSDRWMLVEVALKQTDKIKVTTFVSVGLWETRRVRYYHYYHHFHPYYHHHHALLIYHDDHIVHKAAPQPQPLPPPLTSTKSPGSLPTTLATLAATTGAAQPAIVTPTAPGKTAAGVKADVNLFANSMSEKTIIHLAETNSGPLIAIRVLLFACVGLSFGALFLLLANACNDSNVIRHRYKEKKLALSLAGMCAIALLLAIISWSVFLGTMYRSVQTHGHDWNSLNVGFVCCILASICLVMSIILAACTVDEE